LPTNAESRSDILDQFITHPKGRVEKVSTCVIASDRREARQSLPGRYPMLHVYLAYSCTGLEEIAASRGLRPWLLAMTGLRFFNKPQVNGVPQF